MTQAKDRLVMSLDALLFSVLVAAYLPIRFGNTMPQVVPDDARLTSLLVLAVGCYWLLDLLPDKSPALHRQTLISKAVIISLAIGLLVILPTIRAISLRHETQPYYYVHDGLIQSESAVQFVLSGKNPYVEDYRNTPLAQWGYHGGDSLANPALDHYAYMPLTFLLPLPFQVIIRPNLGWFDQRWVFLGVLVGVLIVATLLSRDSSKRLLLLMVIALNPLFVPFFIEGRNDVLPLFWILLTVLLVQRGNITASALTLALACATKQSAWFLAPFYLAYVSRGRSPGQRWQRLMRPLIVAVTAFGVIVLPWVFADPAAFFNDIFYFQSGLSSSGFPASGFSLGALLYGFGVIKSDTQPFPYWIFQLAASAPLLWFTLRRQWRAPDWRSAMIGYGLLVFSAAFFSQLFHDNYLGFIITILAIAFWADDGVRDVVE